MEVHKIENSYAEYSWGGLIQTNYSCGDLRDECNIITNQEGAKILLLKLICYVVRQVNKTTQAHITFLESNPDQINERSLNKIKKEILQSVGLALSSIQNDTSFVLNFLETVSMDENFECNLDYLKNLFIEKNIAFNSEQYGSVDEVSKAVQSFTIELMETIHGILFPIKTMTPPIHPWEHFMHQSYNLESLNAECKKISTETEAKLLLFKVVCYFQQQIDVFKKSFCNKNENKILETFSEFQHSIGLLVQRILESINENTSKEIINLDKRFDKEYNPNPQKIDIIFQVYEDHKETTLSAFYSLLFESKQ